MIHLQYYCMLKLHFAYISSTTNIPVTSEASQPTVTTSQSPPSSEYAMIQKPTNKKLPHLTVNSGDRYALSSRVNSLSELSTEHAATKKPSVKKVPHLTVDSGERYALPTNQSDEHAQIPGKRVPHLTVNSGDKYALSHHVNSLKRGKQQQQTTLQRTQVSSDNNIVHYSNFLFYTYRMHV